jgi:hypothetical protein
MKPPRIGFPACAVAATLALAACGGGSSSSSTPATPMGTVNVQVTDAPTKDFDHVWVTISAVRFNNSDNVPAGDPSWLGFPLATPVTVDLASLYNGNLASVFSGISLAAGTYKQIRLVLVSDAANLSSSAQAAGLTYNDQVNWTDTTGAHLAPLEVPRPNDGIGLNGTFTVASGTPLDLIVDFDIGHDVVKFLHNGNNAYTLKPNLQYYDLAQVGAVKGSVDTTNLCALTGAVVAVPAGCAYNLVVKAEQTSADGSHHAATRFTTIDAAGNFVLYPVRVPAGQSSTTIDLLVRGRNMDTILVRGVPVTAGTSPTGSPTVVSSAALPLTVDTEYTANASAAVAPTGSWVNFYQTLSNTGQSEIPYEVRYRHLNPFTGLFQDPIPLSTGPIQVGAYVSGGSPSFSPNTPVEADGGFKVFAGAPNYARTEASSDPLTGTAGNASTFAMPALAVDATVASADSISGTITQAVANTYDSGYLVVVRMGTIVTTIPISSVLAQNSGTGGAYSIANLPGGSATQSLPGAYYYLYARVWNSAHPLLTLRRIDFSGYADLRAGSASGVNATLN